VAGVSIDVRHRAQGVATRMMVEFLRQARRDRFPLSTLYPATVTLYQRTGYERVGHRARITVDLRKFRLSRPGQPLRIEQVDTLPEEARQLYRRQAARQPGYLDRGPYIWDRITQPRNLKVRTFLVHGTAQGAAGSKRGRTLEGYLVVSHDMQANGATHVTVVDRAFSTRAAGEAIWQLLAEYQSVATATYLHGGIEDTLLSLLPERHYEAHWLDSWMVRICEPKAALLARGYAPNVSAKVTLLLSDAALPENSGAYQLEVRAGKAAVRAVDTEKGARLTERALAALFTGHRSAWDLRTLGQLEATDAECDALTALFAGRSPCLADMF
jgi:predicted acetyltransferase